MAIKVLSWLVKARRTLTVHEMMTAVSVEPGRFELDELDPPDITTLLDVCGGLAIIDESSNIIRLAHLTVQEYLLRKSIIPEDADYILAKSCITYLSFDAFASGACPSATSLEARVQSHPFLEYAARYVSIHLRNSGEDISKDIVLEFLERAGSIGSWMQIADHFLHNTPKNDWYHAQFRIQQIPLHVASAIGNCAVVQQLLDEGADTLVRAEYSGWSALLEAASHGHEMVVGLLLENGSDISAQNHDKDTALHLAAYSGHLAVVELLVANDADLSISNKYGDTALSDAAQEGHESIVRLLFEKGADVSI